MSNLKENEVFNTWLEMDKQLFPPPELVSEYVAEEDWWARNRYGVIGILSCLALFVASRTAPGIVEVNRAEGFNLVWSWLLAGLGTIGIEGLVIFYGLARARKLFQTQHEEYLDKATPFVASLLGLVISAVAGLRASIVLSDKLSDGIAQGVNVFLAYLLGIGMTLIMFGIAEFVGRIRFVKENAPLYAERQHQEAMRQWRASVTERWRQSSEFWETKGDSITAANVQKARAEAAARYGARGMRDALTEANQSLDFTGTGATAKPMTQIEIAMEWLHQNDPGWTSFDDLPSARILQDTLAPKYKVSSSSTDLARKRYWQEVSGEQV